MAIPPQPRTYTIRPRQDWLDEDRPLLPNLSVYEPDNTPQDTGLLDQRGNKLYAVTPKQQVGFVRKP